MPKIIAKTRVGASKVQTEKINRLFSFGEKQKPLLPSPPLLPHHISPNGSFSRNVKANILASLNSREGIHLLDNIALREGKPKHRFSQKEMNATVDEIYNALCNEKYNGISSKDFTVSEDVIRDYYTSIEKSNPLEVYLESLLEAKSPFELFLYNSYEHLGEYGKFALSRPTWENWTKGGDSQLSLSRIAQYNKIYDSLSDADKRVVFNFMRETGLPMESAIQMMTPEYLNYLKKTSTPFITAHTAVNGEPREFYDSPMKHGLKTKYLRNYGPRGNQDIPFNALKNNKVDIDISLTDIPSNIEHFSPIDLDNIVNNVQYVGNSYPFAQRLYLGGDEGFLRGNGSRNTGAAYGTFNPQYAHAYANPYHSYIGGRVHHVTVGGRPYIPPQNLSDKPHELNGFKIFPESINGEALRHIHDAGFDWFGDFHVENQFSTDNPYRMKNLIGNNGNFDTSDINWFHRTGGRMRFNPLRHKKI